MIIPLWYRMLRAITLSRMLGSKLCFPDRCVWYGAFTSPTFLLMAPSSLAYQLQTTMVPHYIRLHCEVWVAKIGLKSMSALHAVHDSAQQGYTTMIHTFKKRCRTFQHDARG